MKKGKHSPIRNTIFSKMIFRPRNPLLELSYDKSVVRPFEWSLPLARCHQNYLTRFEAVGSKFSSQSKEDHSQELRLKELE